VKVLVLHSLPPANAAAGRAVGEWELAEAAGNVAGVLPGAAVAGVRGDAREILKLLEIHCPDVVFNLCEAPLGRGDREAHVAALLEWLGVRFTGCRSETLALCRRKDWTNAVLAAAGVPVPRAGGFPCIVKPADDDGSACIFADSVCADAEARDRALARLSGPAIVQDFLSGREFVVALWGRGRPEFSSIGETLYRNGLRLITYAAKWEPESRDFVDSPLTYNLALEPPLRDALLAAARGAWQAVDGRGYMRVDIRLDGEQTPHVLDVNPNPEIGPGVGICRAAQEAGWTWEQFVRQQVEWA
jgi:D-alanine-D-alanine ligase